MTNGIHWLYRGIVKENESPKVLIKQWKKILSLGIWRSCPEINNELKRVVNLLKRYKV